VVLFENEVHKFFSLHRKQTRKFGFV